VSRTISIAFAPPADLHPSASATRRRTASARFSKPETSRVTGARAWWHLRATVFIVSLPAGTVRRLTQTVADERDPHFSGDGRRVFFVRDNNVFSIDLDGGLVRQLTDVRPGPAPKDSAKAQGQRGTLEAQQRELFDVIRDRVRQDSIREAERKAREALRIKPFYLGTNERIASLSVSPTANALLLVTSVQAEKAAQTKVPNYVTTSGYTEELTVRTKVGDAQAGGRVAYMKLPSGDLTWLQVVPSDTTRPPSQATTLGWSDDGSAALIFAEARDYKSRYIHKVEAATGKLQTLDVLRDSAWVGGPCYGCGGWVDGGKRIWFVSEADGYAHLYTMDANGGDRRQLTSGKWEVTAAQLSADKRSFELHTSEASRFEQHFYRMPVSGGPRERLTTGVRRPHRRRIAGRHDARRRLLDVQSSARAVRVTQSRWRARDAAHDVAVRGLARVQLDQARDRDGPRVGRRAGAGAHLSAEGRGCPA
jgi:hypothetical protein